MPVNIVTSNEDGSLTVTPLPGTEVCDFCSAPQPVRDFDCVDFQMYDFPAKPPIPNWSRGPWSACAVCASLIDADLWEDLLARTAVSMGVGGEDDPRRGYIRSLHQRFRDARKEKR